MTSLHRQSSILEDIMSFDSKLCQSLAHEEDLLTPPSLFNSDLDQDTTSLEPSNEHTFSKFLLMIAHREMSQMIRKLQLGDQ
jgi:hypothetical protein